MNIIKHPELELGTSLLFDFRMPPFDPVKFSQDLVKTMYEAGGICLTAPQVGVDIQAFAMRSFPENFVCFNPKVVFASDDQVLLEETSLSHPGLVVKIKRPRKIRVRFNTPNGDTRTETFEGLTARTFQHCMDFMGREPFYSRANFFHREQALRRWKKALKGLQPTAAVV